MEIWHAWTTLLASAVTLLAQHFGLSEALAIICLTAIARAGLMPVSLAAALRAETNKEKLRRLKPELEALKERFAGKQGELAAATMHFYREHDIRFFDRLAMLNLGTQAVFGLGLYQALSGAGFTSRFLWIGSLAKPDAWLTAIVAVLMAVAMAVAPGALTEPTMVVLLCVSVAVAVIAVAAMPSAVGVYWATSSAASAVQSGVLRWLVRRLAKANG